MAGLLLANSQRSTRMLPAAAESAPSCAPEMVVSLRTAVVLWQWMREAFHSQTLSGSPGASGSMVTLLLLLLLVSGELLVEACGGWGAPPFIEQASSVTEGQWENRAARPRAEGALLWAMVQFAR
ncbi:uncharacterized protein MONOS_16584 [Monocercomonoides exilis]|uniref:uncharacterized protein n=1 Tax=Monocercomonoides exilis TaxID=2049356 RepID=UPI00355A5635|nr:hypothetical protein MONOS_16584 [Monocercomonoides exilis]|eukprot:MONOS_16584.1-p1 / transcript=MONOS_16584.1 / gene=MONOS_16584 / organism=Monocercomonoides_exilis_PA203 / gene_product=unspecified product / transcript_product=unspecified product / location=Mono_scaffold01883:1918-2292(-) / protein_length=125 / sequence_SO=supercontig / SO=protein_coding / is_pseudo=false